MSHIRYFATVPTGAVELLAEEIKTLGGEVEKRQPSGVWCRGDLAFGYRLTLWSRVANRVYLQLLQAEVQDAEDLYAEVQQVDWQAHMGVETPFSVSFTGSGAGIRHTHFGTLKIKDAIVDQFRNRCGQRPPVETEAHHLALHGHLHKGKFDLFLDMSGFGLHQRGYKAGVRFSAPLKENVAAAVLLRCGWPAIWEAGGALVDPMCGSGTFLVEAAWMVQQRAPQLDNRRRMSFLLWKQHVPELWQTCIEDAEARYAAHRNTPFHIEGRDVSEKSLQAARIALRQAGLATQVKLQQEDVRTQGGVAAETGLVVCNPPYGERLGTEAELSALYEALGQLLKRAFVGWQAGIFACEAAPVSQIGLRPLREHAFRNGALQCKLYRYEVLETHFRHPPLQIGMDLAVQVAARYPDLIDSPLAQSFANRLRKNLKRLRPWVRREQISAFRAYDADMPEFALAVDVYDTLDDGRWVVVYEYAPPKSVDPRKARERLFAAMRVIPEVLGTPAEKVVYKVRKPQKGKQQYQPLQMKRDFHQVQENGARLWVNFLDYLDTGLFLDHRLVRRYVAELSQGKRLLNLFCYTATATVAAAVAGMKQSVSVDMSRTYLDWGAQNFALNGMDEHWHKLVRADVLKWLATPPRQMERFDVIFLDPPSFSTSKRMEGTLDIQRDHVQLIVQAETLLEKNGVLVFSTNLRGFKLNAEVLEKKWLIQNIHQETLPPDFARNPKIHQVWRLEKRDG